MLPYHPAPLGSGFLIFGGRCCPPEPITADGQRIAVPPAGPSINVVRPPGDIPALRSALAPDRLATNSATAPDAALSRSLDFTAPDRIPQQTLDRILWHAVHGPTADPPPPGPNASGHDS